MKISDILKHVSEGQQRAKQAKDRIEALARAASREDDAAQIEDKAAKAERLRNPLFVGGDMPCSVLFSDRPGLEIKTFIPASPHHRHGNKVINLELDGGEFFSSADQHMRERFSSPGPLDNPQNDPWDYHSLRPVKNHSDDTIGVDMAEGPDESVTTVHRPGGELVPGPEGAGKLINATVFHDRLIGAFEFGVYMLEPDGWRKLNWEAPDKPA